MGPGLWTAEIPFADKLPYRLRVNETLLLLVFFAGCQQGGGQIMRTLSGKSVRGYPDSPVWRRHTELLDL